MITKAADKAYALQAVLLTLVSTRAADLRERRDAGVVSIEYLVLGAALIVLIAVVGSNKDVQDALKNAFTGLFGKAAAGSGGAG